MQQEQLVQQQNKLEVVDSAADVRQSYAGRTSTRVAGCSASVEVKQHEQDPI